MSRLARGTRSEWRKGEAPVDYVRFYFLSEPDAWAFRREFA